jgi:hypothetical protein
MGNWAIGPSINRYLYQIIKPFTFISFTPLINYPIILSPLLCKHHFFEK